jgi:hypothetical protein
MPSKELCDHRYSESARFACYWFGLNVQSRFGLLRRSLRDSENQFCEIRALLLEEFE